MCLRLDAGIKKYCSCRPIYRSGRAGWWGECSIPSMIQFMLNSDSLHIHIVDSRYPEVKGHTHLAYGLLFQYKFGNGPISQRKCGKTKPGNGQWIKTESSAVWVYFHSDLTEEEAGFKLQYRFNSKYHLVHID